MRMNKRIWTVLAAVILGVFTVLMPMATPVVEAALTIPADVEKLLAATNKSTLDKVLKIYDSWAGKELKAGKKPGAGLFVAVTESGLMHDVPIICFWGAIRRLQEMGVRVEYNVPADQNAYAATVENIMALKPQAVIVGHGNNQTLGSALEKAGQLKMPLFAVDNWLDGPTVVTEVTSNNFDIGIKAVQYMIGELKGKGNVVALYAPGLRSIEIRHRMYLQVMQEFVNIKEISELPYQQPAQDVARSRMEAALIANPKKGSINAVWAPYDMPAMGAADAIEAAGREDEIFVVGIDGDREAMRRIAMGGALKATVSQDFNAQATWMALMVVDYLTGHAKTLPRFNFFPIELVTKDNVYQVYKDKFGTDLKI